MAVAVVTGANRGLGLGVSEALAQKGYTVIMTARNTQGLKTHVQELKSKKLDVHAFELDTSKPKSIDQGSRSQGSCRMSFKKFM